MTKILILDSGISDIDAASSGFGALETPRGRLPLESLDVRTRICDVTAQTLVRQTFCNALDEFLEATYIFPLPERAAVTKFQMIVAGRTIEGDLKERGQAREDYDRAVAAGHQAAIAEEDRSGVFTLRVGNIPPRERATVELTMVGPLAVADGEAAFRFPLVVAPRYTPGIPLPGPSVGSGTALDTDQSPDASRITPPVLLPGFSNPVRLSLEVELDAAALAANSEWHKQVRCSLHSVIADDGPPWKIRLQQGERLDRDFILRFPVAAKAVVSSLRASAENAGEAGVFALTLVPPAIAASKSPPREIVFLLDRSGSMEGWKMVAARRTLGRMIDTLLDHDRFAVLAFDSAIEHSPLQRGLIPATNRLRWKTLEWLGGIQARGGTELDPAIDEGLQLFSPSGSGAQPILVVVTDGQVTNEDAILRRFRQAAKIQPRVFTVGIDQAVNAGFLQRLAQLGQGQCELVESESRLDEAMDRIHRLIGAPVLTNVRIEPVDIDWIAESLTPRRLPDLFADRPIVIQGRHPSRKPMRLRVSAIDAQGKSWSDEVVARPEENSVLLATWGRSMIRDLEDEYAAGTHSEPQQLMQRIIQVSLESHVLSRFTAYVAVDHSQVVNDGGVQNQILQPVEMPAGWEMGMNAAAGAVMGGATFGMSYCLAAPAAACPMAKMSRSRGAAFSPPPPPQSPAADALRDSDDGSADSLLQEFDDSVDYLLIPEQAEGTVAEEGDSSTVKRLVHTLLRGALREGATEIRIEPAAGSYRVQYRMGGQFVDRETPASSLAEAMIDRLLQMAGLAATGPQHGVLSITIGVTLHTWTLTVTPTPLGRIAILLPAPQDTTPPGTARRKEFWT